MTLPPEAGQQPSNDELPVVLPTEAGESGWAARGMALFEVIACSGFPTQIALGAALAAVGLVPVIEAGALSVRFVVMLSLLDTLAMVMLVLFFLHAHGEKPRAVFFGRASTDREIQAGLWLTPLALVLAAIVLVSVRQFLPWLRTVEHNPLQDLIRTPADVMLFAVVVVLAGGVREEIQRAFILRRFEQSLGGKTVGVIVASAAFGAGHFVQGADAAVATSVLGALWSVVYLRRRSIIAPVVSHAGFNLVQLAQFAMLGR
jgi:membrane protease YdiL (CAAX protease family)